MTDGKEDPPDSMSAAPSGSISVFDSTRDKWVLYHERLENFFIAYNIKSEIRKKALLQTYIGENSYRILRDLCTPDLPSKKTYDELCEIMRSFYTPNVVVYKERKHFYAASKSDGESAAEWMARIKRLASSCEFGANLCNVVLDKFVTGLSGRAFDRISEEKHTELTLERAVGLAMKYEDQTSADAESVNAIWAKQNQHRTGNSSHAGTSGGGGTRCIHCGYKNHISVNCKYSAAVCHTCGKIGHLASVCKNKKKRAANINYVSENDHENCEATNKESVVEFGGVREDYLFYIVNKTPHDCMSAVVKIDKIDFSFVLDSGASISVMPRELFLRHFCFSDLNGTPTKVFSYSGHELVVFGMLKTDVEYNNKKIAMNILIVDSTGPPVLGRDFLTRFGIQFAQINSMTSICNLQELLAHFSALFDGGLGKYKYLQVHLDVIPNSKPIFCKPRPVPYAFREQVDAELLRLETAGVITKTVSCEWGTPLVPVLKSNGGVRICADYKITINKQLIDFKYPLPRIDDVFNSLQGGAQYSKLDLEGAYHQFELDDESREMVTISTHRGVFTMNRLPFGIKPATSIFQRELEKTLLGIPGVVNFLDDIVVTGRNKEEHLANLKEVFQRLLDAGLKLRSDKCVFFKDEISYLGHRLSKNGLAKTSERVEAILKAPIPKNITEVRAFAGLVNYYGKFISGLSQKMAPIYGLLKKENSFQWDDKCLAAFNRIKLDITEDIVLAHFNPDWPIVLTTDASKCGLGAVLSHILPSGEEKPVAFCSRTLSKAESNYSVIQLEALAIVYACRKFYQYLIGYEFTIKTDHRPLLSLFGENVGLPQMAASRIQRWAVFLSGFKYKLKYTKGADNNADALSRLPITERATVVEEEGNYLNFIAEQGVQINHGLVKIETARDPILSKVFKAIEFGKLSELQGEEYKHYVRRHSELSSESGIVMWGYRVVIPCKLRKSVLNSLHASHFGMVKTKSIARSYVWWPRIDSDIEELVKGCNGCLSVRPSPQKAALIPWPSAGKTWSRIHIDYAGPMKSDYYFIVTDSYSKWPEVFRTKTITSEFTISKLREIFARFGLPEVIVSDNGTQFTSEIFGEFVSRNGIRHIVTAVAHPATNGAAENAVGSCKNGLKAAVTNQKSLSQPVNIDTILQRYLFDYRITPHITTGEAPCKLMFGRVIRNRFELLKPPAVNNVIEKKTDDQVKNFRGKRVESFDVHDDVMIRDHSNPNHKEWTRAVVCKVLGPRNYLCKLPNNKIVKRHLDQLIKCIHTQHDENEVDESENMLSGTTVGNTSDSVVDDRIGASKLVDLEVNSQPVTVDGSTTVDIHPNTIVQRPKRIIVAPKRLDL